MSQSDKNLRDKYFANEIFRIGELVEDIATKQKMQIIDRGSNYVTVATSEGISKKWLTEIVSEEVLVKEVVIDKSTPVSITEEIVPQKICNPNFKLLESGQIELFGYETKNFDKALSVYVLEQFDKFDDLYSQHQIIKCLDLSLQESDSVIAYELLEKVTAFCTKNSITDTLVFEQLKTDIERKRIAEIIANIAGITPVKSNYETVRNAIKALKEKYKTRQQWEVLYPFFMMAQDAGIAGVAQNLPFNTIKVSEDILAGYAVLETIEDNIDMFLESADTTKSGIELLTNYMENNNYTFESLEDRSVLLSKLNIRLTSTNKV